MSDIWRYKEEIQDAKAFEKVEECYGITIPEEMKTFVKEHNGASPEKCVFRMGDREGVFGAVLSFDSGETQKATVYQAMDTVQDKTLLPFATDPFGDYICLSLENGSVVFWDHETDEKTCVGSDVRTFLSGLCEM